MKFFLLSIFASLLLIAPVRAETVVEVKGMVCEFCAQTMNKVFLEQDGVSSIDVDLDAQTVTLHYEDGAKALEAASIQSLIEHAGYTFVGVSED